MSELPRIRYARETTLDVAEFRRVLEESGMGAIRPIDDESRLRAMISGATLIVTARLAQSGTPLVGLIRGITDSVWSCYVAEVAVVASAQRLGIGKGLLDEARRQLGAGVTLNLVSVPEAVGFYERAGMESVRDVFRYRRDH
jgi:ribosomal protein S18 acetylase RimI-like enzyme